MFFSNKQIQDLYRGQNYNKYLEKNKNRNASPTKSGKEGVYGFSGKESYRFALSQQRENNIIFKRNTGHFYAITLSYL